MVGKNVGYSFLSWTVIYLCVAFGLKWTGRITYFTMDSPLSCSSQSIVSGAFGTGGLL